MTTVRLLKTGYWEVVLLVGPVHGNARGVTHRLRKLGLEAELQEDGTVLVEIKE